MSLDTTKSCSVDLNPPSETIQEHSSLHFTFDHIGDKQGILYAIGCEDNGVWKNPVSTNKIAVTASSTYRGTPAMVADHTFACQIFYTDNKPYSWVRVDFKESAVCPTYYSMAHRAGFDGYYLRDWQLQASNDAKQWVVLKEHKADETLNKKSLAGAWPLDCGDESYRYFQVVIAPGGNSNGTNALILSCFELYGALQQHPQGSPDPPAAFGSPAACSDEGSVEGPVSMAADVARPPARLPDGQLLYVSDSVGGATGHVVAVSWQGGTIQIAGDLTGAAALIPYHKSDVWVDDKKVKQLPREGDLVAFYVGLDEVTKREKAEQVTVVSPSRHTPQPSRPHPPAPNGPFRTADSPPRDGAQTPPSSKWGKPSDKGSKLNPEAPSFKPRTTPPASCDLADPAAAHVEMEGVRSPGAAGEAEPKSSFLFEHCTGRVVAVTVPTGRIQIDGAPPDSPPMTYHYSDVWDDGKCVKQFPRVGDTVSCYIGIDAKTRKEKAENVKVICKRPQAEDSPPRTEVQQTIENAHHRASAHAAQAGPARPSPPTGSPPTPKPHSKPEAVVFVPRPDAASLPPFGPYDPAPHGFPTLQGRPPMPYGRPITVGAPPVVGLPPVFLPTALPGPYGYRPNVGLAPVLGAASPNAFAPVLTPLGRSPFSPGLPMTPPPRPPITVASPVVPMQYRDAASPLLFSVGRARPSPPQSPSPSPSLGLSRSTNSSVGTLNASYGEADAFAPGPGAEFWGFSSPSPASHSPSEALDPAQCLVDVDTLACTRSEEDIAPLYSTPMKRTSSLSMWMADEGSGPAAKAAGRSARCRLSPHDPLEALVPRSPIIGDILRDSSPPAQDEVLDHDLLSGEGALLALHAVSVLEF